MADCRAQQQMILQEVRWATERVVKEANKQIDCVVILALYNLIYACSEEAKPYFGSSIVNHWRKNDVTMQGYSELVDDIIDDCRNSR